MGFLDNDGVLYFWQKIKNAFALKTDLNSKVDKVTGKGLSTNDYTTDEKNKLAGIAAGAKDNVIETVKKNGTALTVTNKAVDIVLGKSDVGLGNVDNTSDANKPVSTAQQTALDGKVDKATDYGVITKQDVTNGYNLSIRKTDNGSIAEESFSVVALGSYTATMQQAMAALNGKADASELENYALKSDITNMYKYKGSVATISALSSTGNTTGDVYNVEASGMNYAWNGSEWDSLGEIFQITAITNAEIDAIVAS